MAASISLPSNSLFAQSTTSAISKEESSSEEEDDEEDEEEDEGGGDADESYEHIEGAYQAKDYQHLNVAAEVRDLFQYIERYKPHEVELDTTLKCFIPEYIPAIGEIDGFVKVRVGMYMLLSALSIRHVICRFPDLMVRTTDWVSRFLTSLRPYSQIQPCLSYSFVQPVRSNSMEMSW